MPKRNKEMEEFSRKVKEDFKDSSVMPSIEDPNKRACALISCRPAHDKLREISKNYPVNYRRCAKILKMIEQILFEMGIPYKGMNAKISLAIYLVHPYSHSFIAECIMECSPCDPLKNQIIDYLIRQLKDKTIPEFWLSNKKFKERILNEHPLFKYRKWYGFGKTIMNSLDRIKRLRQWKITFALDSLRTCPLSKECHRKTFAPDEEMPFKCTGTTSEFKWCIQFYHEELERQKRFEEYKKERERVKNLVHQ